MVGLAVGAGVAVATGGGGTVGVDTMAAEVEAGTVVAPVSAVAGAEAEVLVGRTVGATVVSPHAVNSSVSQKIPRQIPARCFLMALL